MLKYIRFLQRLGKEKYYIASAKRYLLMPMVWFWGVMFLLFLFFGGDSFSYTVGPILFLMIWPAVWYSRFFKIFGYNRLFYYLLLVGVLLVLCFIGRTLHPMLFAFLTQML
ncbi:MAG: hypothetical protein E7655_02055 [Ruminococcaceae bacterium]|nr:hypothetical protein [Oscillospiraceae bacterium]